MRLIDKYSALAETVKEQYQKERQQIERQDKWTDQAKMESVAELSQRFNAHLAKLKSDLQEERTARVKKLERKLFAVGDDSTALAYRSAISQAESVAESREELSELMFQSLVTDDQTLSKGVAFVAVRHGYHDIAAEAFSGSSERYFEEYVSLQASLSNPVSKERLEESFVFASVI